MSDMEKCHAVLAAWDKFGVSGVTVLESVGMQKIRQLRAQRDDLPLFPSLRHLVESEEYHHRTIFVVVDDDFDWEGLIRVTEQAIGGDFAQHWRHVCFARDPRAGNETVLEARDNINLPNYD
jgi:hypothetical protein